MAQQGRLVYTSTGMPCYKRYLDEMPGVPLQNDWADIRPASRSLGYATQKPLALLERIIQASCDEGDVVLDPFCGCGTTVAAAEKLKRRWIGIDITHLAVALMKNRLKTTFNIDAGKDYRVVGEPEDVGEFARALWEQDAYQFQYWAMSLLEAQPRSDQKKGADRGIDGLLYFIDGQKRTSQKVVVQVKGGHVSSPQIRDLKGTVEREKAADGAVHHVGGADGADADRGGERGVLSLRHLAAGLPEDTVANGGGVAGGAGLRVASAVAFVRGGAAASRGGGAGAVGVGDLTSDGAAPEAGRLDYTQHAR